jgi:hypothetical protein
VPAESASPSARLGGVARVGPLQVRPQRIVEDSRCPMNARCVWAGRLILRAEVRGNGRRSMLDLTLGEATSAGGGQLTLEQAQPDRMAGRPLSARDYRFTFSFTPR